MTAGVRRDGIRWGGALLTAGDDQRRLRAVKPLAATLSTVVADLGGGRGGDLVRILNCWSEVVGAAVAEHTRVRDLRGGVLTVVVDHPGWATQLRYLRARIAGELNSALGAEVVSSVEIRVRSDRRSGGRGPRS